MATATLRTSRNIRHNPNIFKKKANKGSNFTILNKDLYVQEANRQLSDS